MTPGSVSTAHLIVAACVWGASFALAVALCWQDAREADRREGPQRKAGR